MSRTHAMRVAVAVVLTALGAFAAARIADAAGYRSYTKIEGTKLPSAGSAIELTHVVMVAIQPREFDEKDWTHNQGADAECVTFVNHGPRVVKHVLIRFSYRADDGTEVGHDVMDVNGTFSPGLTHGSITADDPNAPGQTCRIYPNGVEDRSDFQHFRWGTPRWVTLAASVHEVDYADGTSWRGLGLVGDGYLGSVRERTSQQPASPVQIRDAFAANFGAPTGSACVFFVNNGSRTVTHAVFSLSYRTNEIEVGKEVGSDVLHVYGSFAPGMPVEPWPTSPGSPPAVCRPIAGSVVTPRTPLLGALVQRFREPRIHYAPADKDVTLFAGVQAVYFDDGSSWLETDPDIASAR